MVKVVIPKDFKKMLSALGKADRNGQAAARKAEAACTQAQVYGEIRLPRTKHGESRLDCEKYDLGDGYRLVVQRMSGDSETHLVMLFVGTHAESDTWLNAHRDYKWVMRDSDGKLDFIQVTPKDVPRPPVQVEVSFSTPDHVLEEPLIAALSDDEMKVAGLTDELIHQLRALTKGDWGEFSDKFIDDIEVAHGTQVALLVLDVLEMCDHGDAEGARQRLRLEAHEAREAGPEEVMRAVSIPANSEEFFTWVEEEGMPSPSNREDWMLYLHPEQSKVAFASFQGAVRLRGVSGSGKTCVLVHRARFLARKYDQPVLVVSLTGSMRKLLEQLVISLCGAERSLITVATVSSLAKDIVRDLHPMGERWYTMADSQVKSQALDAAARVVEGEFSHNVQSLARLTPVQLRKFLAEEFSFIKTRLLPEEYAHYAESGFSRAGRGRALGESGRNAVLAGLEVYENYLRGLNKLDDEGIAQLAVQLLQKVAERSAYHRYRAVLADEVQDLSQNEIRLLASLRTPRAHEGDVLKSVQDGLFLVGDGAQTVFKRGFSLRSIGIQLSRSLVFKKNYRNTFEILQAAYSVIRNHEFADTDEDNRQRPQTPDFAARRGERPKLVRCGSIRDEIDYAVYILKKLREIHGDEALADACVISRVPPIREGVIRNLRDIGISCVNLKENVPINYLGVRVSTIESAKGFEFGTVVLCGVSELLAQAGSGESESGDADADAAKIYVAMTRARDSLHITYTSNAERGASKVLLPVSDWCENLRYEQGVVRAML